MMNRDEKELMRQAQLDFEKHFGVSMETKVYVSHLANESMIVVETHIKRAFYDMNVDLIKVINLTGEQ